MPDDGNVGAVGIHAGGETSDPDVAVITSFAGGFLGHVGAAHEELFAGLVGEDGAAVALIPIPLTIRPGRDAVETVIVLATREPAEENLTPVDAGMDFPVPVFVGVDEHFGRLRDDDAVIEHSDTEGRRESRFLHKDRGLVGAARPVGVFEDDDAIAFRTTPALAAVVDTLGDVETPLRVEVDVGRISEHRRGRPDRHLKSLGHGEKVGRDHLGRIGVVGTARGDGRLLRVDAETQVRRARLALALHPAIVDRETCLKAIHALGQGILEQSGCVGADALFVGRAPDAEGPAHDVFILLRFAVSGLGFLPLELGEVADAPVFHDQLRLDPVGPVTGQRPFVGDDEVEFLRAIERDIDGDEAFFAFRSERFGFKDGFYLRLRLERKRCGVSNQDE